MRSRKHDIERYLRGELSPAEMHALEKEALNDPFLAEALEGVEHAGADNFLYDLHEINRSMYDKLKRSPRKSRKSIRIWGWTSSVAATLLILVVAGFLAVHYLREQREQAAAIPPFEIPASTDTLTVIMPGIALAETTEQPTRAQYGTTPPVRHEAGSQPEQPAIAAGPPQETAKVEESITTAAESEVRSDAFARERLATIPLRRAKVSGKVTDESGQTLPGVNVSAKGTDASAVTDSEGRYELAIPGDSATLAFDYIGFEAQEVAASPNREVNVVLEEDITTLSEVVVIGAAAKKTSGDKSPEPIGGKASFNNYLAKSVRYPEQAARDKVEGKVTVRFAVEPDGELTDFQIVKGIGSGCEEELIRAIRQGPKWQPATNKGTPVRSVVKVGFRFGK